MRRLVTIFVIFPALLTLSACQNGGGGGEPPASTATKMSGLWVEETELQLIENLKEADGSCRSYSVSEADEVNKYYLEVIQIQSDGAINSLATINKDSSDTGDFHPKWTLSSDGTVTFQQSFLNAFSGLVEVKEYNHKMNLMDDDTIESHIIKQVSIHEGQVSTMEDEKDLYFRISQQELNDLISFGKDCASKQTLN